MTFRATFGEREPGWLEAEAHRAALVSPSAWWYVDPASWVPVRVQLAWHWLRLRCAALRAKLGS